MCELVCKAPVLYSSEKPVNYSTVKKITSDEENLVCSQPINDSYKPSTKKNTSGVFIDPTKLSFDKSKIATTKKSSPVTNQDNDPTMDNKNLVCVDPKNLVNTKNTHVSSDKFSANLDNSNVIIDMHLDVTDSNGFNNLAKDDITGKISVGKVDVSHNLFDKAIFGLKGYNTKDGKRTTEVKDVTFDANSKAYILDLKVTQNITKAGYPLFWDNFQVKFQVNNSGQLTAKLDKNWILDSMIIDKLQSVVTDKIKNTIPEKYRNVSVNIEKKKDELILIPEIKNLEVPIAGKGSFTVNHIDGQKAKLAIDNKGNLQINLNDVDVKGSSSLTQTQDANTSKTPDIAEVDLKVGIGKDNKKQVYAKGKISIDLDEKETKSVKIGNENLGSYLTSAKIIDDFSVYATQSPDTKPEVEAKNYVYLQDAKLGEHTVDLATNLDLKIDAKGISLEAIDKADKSPLNIPMSKNGIEPVIGGPNFLKEMAKQIKNSKESINLETYELINDSTGTQVAYMLAKRAAGLDITENKAVIPPQGAKGIDVKVIFNSWQGNLEEGHNTEKMLKETIDKVKNEINSSNLTKQQKESAVKNLEKNLNWKFFTEGILRSDHRKVFVVDGMQASVGGINMNNFHLANDSAHDIMVKMAGPEVRNVQKEFLENWFEFNNLPKPSSQEMDGMLKSPEALNKNLAALQAKGSFKTTSDVGVLVTDDHQNDISKGILKLIDDSKKEVFVEQAFFADSKINQHLSNAIKRGVKVNVIVAKNSLAPEVFNDANLYSVYQLLKTQRESGKGEVKLFYYDEPNTNAAKYIHTKAISADGDKAIVGSANMIGRSMEGPFKKVEKDGSTSNIMYNKEMSLYFEGSQAVEDIDNKLFKNDIKTKSQEITPEQIDELVRKAGGEDAIKKKFLMAMVT